MMKEKFYDLQLELEKKLGREPTDEELWNYISDYIEKMKEKNDN